MADLKKLNIFPVVFWTQSRFITIDRKDQGEFEQVPILRAEDLDLTLDLLQTEQEKYAKEQVLKELQYMINSEMVKYLNDKIKKIDFEKTIRKRLKELEKELQVKK